MKNINIEFEEKEFKKILKVKEISKLSWRNFILFLVEKSAEENHNKGDFLNDKRI
ncbi:MAG: hypothetical protein AABY22_04475 [Nanoarchaeota archaeon]